jgi:hypothetical protein
MTSNSLAVLVLLASGALVTACTATCTATADKLALLRRGMSQAEATGVMGCAGNPVAPADPRNDLSSLEWRGPGTVVMATQLDFQNDQLLYYVTWARSGL